MKKRLLACVFILFYIALLLPASAGAREPIVGSLDIFLLPANLEEIGEDAFARTAVRVLILQEKLAFIGSGAFSDTAFLTDVFIPPSVENIGECAFPANSAYIFHGKTGSFAKCWAEKYQVGFVESNIWDTIPSGGKNIDSPPRGNIPV